eukprot:357405-Chlamydomonas_euryale.AAC.8
MTACFQREAQKAASSWITYIPHPKSETERRRPGAEASRVGGTCKSCDKRKQLRALVARRSRRRTRQPATERSCASPRQGGVCLHLVTPHPCTRVLLRGPAAAVVEGCKCIARSRRMPGRRFARVHGSSDSTPCTVAQASRLPC